MIFKRSRFLGSQLRINSKGKPFLIKKPLSEWMKIRWDFVFLYIVSAKCRLYISNLKFISSRTKRNQLNKEKWHDLLGHGQIWTHIYSVVNWLRKVLNAFSVLHTFDKPMRFNESRPVTYNPTYLSHYRNHGRSGTNFST